MIRPDAEKARACVGMRAGRVRARAALLALRRMPRGCLVARGVFGCNLVGRATVLIFLRTVSFMRTGERQKSGKAEGDHLPCVA